MSGSDSHKRPPIVLCCAEEDRSALGGIVGLLEDQGYPSRFLTGVDLDATVLGRDLDEHLLPAVYVLCGSEDLDSFQINRLEGMFGARSGPDQRCVAVSLSALASEIISTIERTAEKIAVRVSTSVHRGPAESSGLREMVGKSKLSEVTEAAPVVDRDDLAREFFRAMVETEALLKRPRPKAEAPEKPEPVAEASDKKTAPGKKRRREVSGEEAARRAAAQREPTVEMPVAQRPDAEASTPSEVSVATLAPEEAPAQESGSPPLLWAAAALLIIGGTGAFLAFAPGPSSEEVARSANPVAEAPVASARSASLSHQTLAAGGDAGPESSPPDASAPADAEPEPGAAAEVEATAEPASADPGPPPPGEPESGSGPSAKVIQVPSANTELTLALESEEVQELGPLLVWVRGEDTMAWRRAANLCGGSKVAGIDDWHVPTVGQLKRLARARILPPGEYWSRTLPDGDNRDLVYVVDERRKTSERLKMEVTGRMVCVHKRRPESDAGSQE